MKIDKEIIDSYIFIGLIPIFLVSIISLVISSINSIFWGCFLFIIGEIFVCGIIFTIFYIREIWSQKC